jgi:hypothetical protein
MRIILSADSLVVLLIAWRPPLANGCSLGAHISHLGLSNTTLLLGNGRMATSQRHWTSKWTLQAHSQPLPQAIAMEDVATRQPSGIVTLQENIEANRARAK